jgi:hypothetical protein
VREFRSVNLPDLSSSTALGINWDLEITKSILIEKIQTLKRFCLRELNQFIDDLIETPLIGRFDDFLHEVDEARTFRVLEQSMLHIIDYVDNTFENLIARGEQVLLDFKLVLPRSLNLPALRNEINAYIVEDLLPLFMSEYAVAPVMGSRK